MNTNFIDNLFKNLKQVEPIPMVLKIPNQKVRVTLNNQICYYKQSKTHKDFYFLLDINVKSILGIYNTKTKQYWSGSPVNNLIINLNKELWNLGYKQYLKMSKKSKEEYISRYIEYKDLYRYFLTNRWDILVIQDEKISSGKLYAYTFDLIEGNVTFEKIFEDIKYLPHYDWAIRAVILRCIVNEIIENLDKDELVSLMRYSYKDGLSEYEFKYNLDSKVKLPLFKGIHPRCTAKNTKSKKTRPKDKNSKSIKITKPNSESKLEQLVINIDKNSDKNKR